MLAIVMIIMARDQLSLDIMDMDIVVVRDMVIMARDLLSVDIMDMEGKVEVHMDMVTERDQQNLDIMDMDMAIVRDMVMDTGVKVKMFLEFSIFEVSQCITKSNKTQ